MSESAHAALRWLHRVETGLVALLVLAMVVLAGAQIVLRNFFDTGLAWLDPVLRAMVLWAAMLGALAAAREDKHIGIDFLAHFVHGRARRVMRCAALLFAAGISALMAWHGYGLVQLDYGSDVSVGGIPGWIVEAVLPAGFGLLAARFLLRAFAAPREEALPVLAPELP